MKFVFTDIEATDKDPYNAEVIEAFFEVHDEERNKIDFYDFKCRVNNWSDEAALVHNIDYNEHIRFPKKDIAWGNLIKWLNDLGEYTMVMYVNHEMFGEDVWYDYAVIFMEVMDHLGIDSMNKIPFKPVHKISVYDMYKDLYKRGVIGKPENFSQENVYKLIFDRKYKSHRAYRDVISMIELYYWALDANENNVFQKDQMKLL